MQTQTQITRAEALAALQAGGFKIVEDGSVVIVISKASRQKRTSLYYGNSFTIARRYETPQQAAKMLLKTES